MQHFSALFLMSIKVESICEDLRQAMLRNRHHDISTEFYSIDTDNKGLITEFDVSFWLVLRSYLTNNFFKFRSKNTVRELGWKRRSKQASSLTNLARERMKIGSLSLNSSKSSRPELEVWLLGLGIEIEKEIICQFSGIFEFI